MAYVYVSLGSNIEREHNMRSCLKQLAQTFTAIETSTVYETPAEGFAGEPFLNAVVGFETTLTISELKTYLRQLEDDHGRIRGENKFSARTLDADLLLYDNAIDADNKLPHPDITDYAFVLFPLQELAPGYQHPLLKRSINAIAETSSLDKSSMKIIVL